MSLFKKVIKKLIKRDITISVVELCTGGLLSSQFTSVAGISKVFNMGLVTYSNKAKSDILWEILLMNSFYRASFIINKEYNI